jgi:hypothetical protein
MMNEIRIQNETSPELCFRGQLISETKIDINLDDQEKRQFNLQVFAVEGGGFVATLLYQSSCDSEQRICWLEDMDQFKDVENFFYVFEANEVILGFDRLNRSDRENAALTCKRIAAGYENSLFRFLDTTRHRANEQKFGDRIPEKGNLSIFRALGFKRD